MLRSTTLILFNDCPLMVTMVRILEGWFRSFVGIVLFPSPSIGEYGDPIAAARREVANKETPTVTIGKNIAKEKSTTDCMDEIPLWVRRPRGFYLVGMWWNRTVGYPILLLERI